MRPHDTRRDLLRGLYDAAVAAAHPRSCLPPALPPPPPAPGRIIVLAAGKAAASMTAVTVAHYTPLLAGALDRRLEVWERDGFAPIRSAWLEHAVGLGEPMLLRTAQEETEGRFMDLEQDGTLVMELASGLMRRVSAGDVTPLVAVG